MSRPSELVLDILGSERVSIATISEEVEGCAAPETPEAQDSSTPFSPQSLNRRIVPQDLVTPLEATSLVWNSLPTAHRPANLRSLEENVQHSCLESRSNHESSPGLTSVYVRVIRRATSDHFEKKSALQDLVSLSSSSISLPPNVVVTITKRSKQAETENLVSRDQDLSPRLDLKPSLSPVISPISETSLPPDHVFLPPLPVTDSPDYARVPDFGSKVDEQSPWAISLIGFKDLEDNSTADDRNAFNTPISLLSLLEALQVVFLALATPFDMSALISSDHHTVFDLASS